MAGVIPSGVYTTSSKEACVHIASHSKMELLVVEDNTQLEKYRDDISNLPTLKAVVMYSEQPRDDAIGGVPIYTFEEFMALGVNVPQTELDAREANISPGNCCALIYTSGTSGTPKGVMISHDNVTWSTQTLVDSWLPFASNQDRVVSYLPLSHVSAQLVDLHTPMCNGSCTYVAQPDALKGSLLATLLEVKPTIFFGVPR
jgi:long-chain-fatty-acid--CoA ligase ACSBG